MNKFVGIFVLCLSLINGLSLANVTPTKGTTIPPPTTTTNTTEPTSNTTTSLEFTSTTSDEVMTSTDVSSSSTAQSPTTTSPTTAAPLPTTTKLPIEEDKVHIVTELTTFETPVTERWEEIPDDENSSSSWNLSVTLFSIIFAFLLKRF